MGRIVRPADFQRVLGTSPWARSSHFAVHHLQQSPGRTARPASVQAKLSTVGEQSCPQLVDESLGSSPEPTPVDGWWLGLVVPKRHARRSVTRNLLKRQIRAAVGAAVPPKQPAGSALRPGLWVVRLRSVIDRKQYPSASSQALRQAMHDELSQLVHRAIERCHA
ncbi:MAG: ribonuclease P protein component [Ideonella sp.]